MHSRKCPNFSASLHLSSQLHQLLLLGRSAQDGVEKRVDRLFDVSFVAIGAWGILHSGTSSVIRGLVLDGR